MMDSSSQLNKGTEGVQSSHQLQNDVELSANEGQHHQTGEIIAQDHTNAAVNNQAAIGDQANVTHVTGDLVNVTGDLVNATGDLVNVTGDLVNVTGDQTNVAGDQIQATVSVDKLNVPGDQNTVILANTVHYRKRDEYAEMEVKIELIKLKALVETQNHKMDLLVKHIEALTVQQEPIQRVSEHMEQTWFQTTISAIGVVFCQNAFGRLDRGKEGSIFLYVRFSNRTELGNIWQAYQDGRLVEELTRVIITDDLQEVFGCSVQLDVFADEKEYHKGLNIFDQLDAKKVFLPSSMSDWATHHVKQFLLQEGIPEEITRMFFEEEIDGGVLHGYTADEMVEDFKLKKGPIRKILRARDRFLSQTQEKEEKPHLQSLPSLSVEMSTEESHEVQRPVMKASVRSMETSILQDVSSSMSERPPAKASQSLSPSSGMGSENMSIHQKTGIKSTLESVPAASSMLGARSKVEVTPSQEEQKQHIDAPSSSAAAMSSEESGTNKKSDIIASVRSVETGNLPDRSNNSGARPKVKASTSSQVPVTQAFGPHRPTEKKVDMSTSVLSGAEKSRPIPVEKKVDVLMLSEAEKRLRKHLLSDDTLNLDMSFYPVLVANKPILNSTQCSEEFEQCFSFISAIHWSAVLDFNADSNESGLAKFYSRKCKARWQLPETIQPANLSLSEVPLWMFCNGRHDDENVTSSRFPRQEWREQRRESVENVISTFANPSFIPSSRAVIIFLILSDDDIGILSDAFSKFYTAFHGMANITCICADKGLYDLWAKEASSICGGTQVLKDNSIVGVPWNTINKYMKRMSNATQANSCTLPYARIPIEERKLQSWTDLYVVCKNECENTDMDENHPDYKAFKKETELEFYRGHKVQWWNFAFTDQKYDHVLQRTVYNSLQSKVNYVLQAGKKLVEVITIYHQAGSGGSTLAHHILWEFHKDYRCAVINSFSSPETARQILELRKFGHTTEMECLPVVILADDLDEPDLDQLQLDLETFSKDSKTSRATAVILQCKRTSEPQDMHSRECKGESGRYGITVQHELDEPERKWFRRKYEELERRVKHSHDYQPKKLIAFMAMKSEFNPKYIQSVVSDVLPDVQQYSERAYQLLTYTALVNRYNADAVIPVSCCDEFMSGERGAGDHTPWEKAVSGSFNMLMIPATVHVQNVGNVSGVKLVSQGVAEEITKQLAEEKDKPLADLTEEFLKSDILGSQAYVKDRYLKPTIHNILIQRKMAPGGMMSLFSDLIEQVQFREGNDKALTVLHKGYQTLNDPICAQQAARLCIRQQNYEKAHEYIQLALENVPKNSYFLHTKGEIFRNQIKDIDAQYSTEDNKTRLPVDETKRICQIGFSGIKTFKDCQKYAEEEKRDNLYGCFGELEISLTLIDIIYRMEPFSGTGPQEQLKDYLLKDPVPDGMEELNDFHAEFKKLKDSIDKALADIENYTTLFKDKDRSQYGVNRDVKQLGVLQQHANLVKGFRKDYARFFGVPQNSTPPENPADLPEWYRARVVALGADSVYDIFELANDRNNEENRAKLRDVYNLLSQIKPPKFKDLRQLICSILALSCMDVHGTEDLPSVDNVNELVRQLNERSGRSDIIGPFFRLMFLWPHPNATFHRLKQNGELRRCKDDLKNRWDETIAKKKNRSQKMDAYNPTLHQNRPHGLGQKPRTYFFLANGEGLRQFAHIHELKVTQSHLDSDRDQFWTRPDVRERLTLLKGTLYNNNLLSYKTPTGEIIRITLSKPKLCGTDSQEPVEFYLGFSWSGPRAYNVKYIDPAEEHQLQPTRQRESQPAIDPWTFTDSTKFESDEIKKLREQMTELEVLQNREKGSLTYKEKQRLKSLPKVRSDLRKLLEKKRAQEKH